MDDSEKLKRRTLSASKRRKLLGKFTFAFLCIAAAVVVILCILSIFVD